LNRPNHSRWRLAAAAATIALVAAACGSSSPSKSSSSTTSGGGSGSSSGTNTASAPGITASTITIGSHQPLTGPAAPGYDEIAPASSAMFQYVNAHGGVYGRKIVYNYQDDGYNPANTATVVRKLVLQDNVFAIFNGLGTPTHEAVVSFLNNEKVPDLFVASGCDCWDNPSGAPETFGWQTDYTIEGKILGHYEQQHYAGQKVGYLYQNDDFGQGGVKGFNQEIPAADVVAKQSYDATTAGLANGLGNQVSAIKAAGAKVVMLDTIPAATALTLLAAAEIGYTPVWILSSVGGDPPTLSGLLSSISKGKAGASLENGVISASYLPSFSDTANPWISLFKQIHDQYDTKQPWDGNTVYGMAVAYTFVQLMHDAGRNPTRAGLVSTLESKGRSLTGPGLVPFAFSSAHHNGYTGEQIGVVQNGAFNLSGPIYTTADSSGTGISTYSGTQPSPPSSF
jgi:branched-chain amino acid transport system substrate-binding protein